MDINRIEQRKIDKRESSKTKKQLLEQQHKESQDILDIKEKIRHELNRNIYFDRWGLQNALIEDTMRVRMTEDIIALAKKM